MAETCIVEHMADIHCCLFHMMESGIVVCSTWQRHVCLAWWRHTLLFASHCRDILFPMAVERHALLLQLDLFNVELSPNSTFSDEDPRVLIYLQCCLSFIWCFFVSTGHGGWDMRAVLPALQTSGPRHSQVLPVLHRGLQTNLQGEARGDWHIGQQNEHRSVD